MTMDLTVFLCEVSAFWGNRGDLPAETDWEPSRGFYSWSCRKDRDCRPSCKEWLVLQDFGLKNSDYEATLCGPALSVVLTQDPVTPALETH